MVDDLLAPVRELTGRVSWLKARKGASPMEKRIVLRRAGRIDPENIEDSIAEDGYQALAKAISHDPHGSHLRTGKLRPAGTRRGRFPDRHQVAFRGRDEICQEIRGLQRR